MIKGFHKYRTTALLTGALCLSLCSFVYGESVQGGDLQSIVDSANAYANSQNYVDAIPLYEKAVQLAPNEATLKRNLSVLYFNRGVELQNQNQYEEANALFDKSLALIPDQPEALKAKAASFYYQGLDLRESGETDFNTLKTVFEQAIELDPETPAFKKALASVYLGEARNLANLQRYEDAALLLETARNLDPDAQAIRQSLANIYLGSASQQENDRDQQEIYIKKALAVDSSPAIQQRAKAIRAGKMEYGSQTGIAVQQAPQQRVTAPPNTNSWSIQEKLAAVEKALSMEVPEDASLIERLKATEKQVFGDEQEGALDERSDALFATLLGSGQTVRESLPNLIQPNVQTAENTYLEDIFNYTDGRVVRWARFPVRVYIEPPKDNALYKPEYEEAAIEGLNAWKGATNSFVSYTKVKNRLAADIQIYWTDEYEDRFTVAESYENNILKDYTPPKNSKLAQTIGMASMFAPGPFALAPQAVAAGLQYRQNRKIQVLEDESIIYLGLNPTRDLSPEGALILIQNMAAYEFGHALGLKGISDDPKDLMHPGLSSDQKRFPTARDMATLREIYTRPPNIILNVK